MVYGEREHDEDDDDDDNDDLFNDCRMPCSSKTTEMQRTESQAGPATKPPVAKQAAKPDANTAKSVLQGSGGKLAQGVEARQL